MGCRVCCVLLLVVVEGWMLQLECCPAGADVWWQRRSIILSCLADPGQPLFCLHMYNTLHTHM